MTVIIADDHSRAGWPPNNPWYHASYVPQNVGMFGRCWVTNLDPLGVKSVVTVDSVRIYSAVATAAFMSLIYDTSYWSGAQGASYPGYGRENIDPVINNVVETRVRSATVGTASPVSVISGMRYDIPAGVPTEIQGGFSLAPGVVLAIGIGQANTQFSYAFSGRYYEEA